MHILRTGEVAQISLPQDLLPGPQGFHRGRGGYPGLGIGVGCGAGQERERGPPLETDEPALNNGAGDAAAGVAVVYGYDGEVSEDIALRA